MARHGTVIIKVLRRNAAIVCMAGIQIAISIALILNSGDVVSKAVRYGATRIGIDETNVGVIQSIIVVGKKNEATISNNLRNIAQLPGVAAVAFGDFPFGGAAATKISTQPNASEALQVHWLAGSQGYSEALGLQVKVGSSFSALDIPPFSSESATYPALITEAVAEKLFKGGDAIGRIFYSDKSSFRVIGIVHNLKAVVTDKQSDDLTIVTSRRYTDEDFGGFYIIRATPNSLDKVMPAAESLLGRIAPSHVQSFSSSFGEVRKQVFGDVLGPAKVLGTVIVVLVLMMGFSIGALTSYWVNQRKSHIGIRRALGARKVDIIFYFVIENLILVGGSAVAGVILAIAFNLLLRKHFELGSLNPSYCILALFVTIIIGQAFALPWALKGAKTDAAASIRSL